MLQGGLGTRLGPWAGCESDAEGERARAVRRVQRCAVREGGAGTDDAILEAYLAGNAMYSAAGFGSAGACSGLSPTRAVECTTLASQYHEPLAAPGMSLALATHLVVLMLL
jgi:hypothetical protein